VTTFIQGIGMGLVFVPMNLVAFATLSPMLRTDGSALINLVRNVGSAIGVSLTTTVLASSYQVVHAQLSENATPFNRALSVNAPSMMMNPILPFGAQSLNSMIDYNAYVIAYANDFLFMFYACMPALLVIWLMRRPPMLAPNEKLEISE
jgi:DHA2 family multidrug resistance protein